MMRLKLKEPLRPMLLQKLKKRNKDKKDARVYGGTLVWINIFAKIGKIEKL